MGASASSASGLVAGGLDRRQPVAQHRSEDFDHLPVAVVRAGELPPDAVQRRRQHRARIGDKPVLIDAGALTNHDAAENRHFATHRDATSPHHATPPAGQHRRLQ